MTQVPRSLGSGPNLGGTKSSTFLPSISLGLLLQSGELTLTAPNLCGVHAGPGGKGV
jgi:hypothetical protein